jgi:hypothetical protein
MVRFCYPRGSIHLFQTRKEKREVSATLQKVLAADVILTDKLCNWANCCLPLRSLRLHYKVLEVKDTYSICNFTVATNVLLPL